MATRLRLPTLFDVVVVDDPREMDWFERDPGITREISGAGGWLHHVIHSRIQNTLTVDSTRLPVFSGQGIAGRAIQQEKLESRLSDPNTAPDLDPDAMQALARYVAGAESDESVGVAAQQVVGRMFISTYTASPESYAAAKRVHAAIKAGPVRALWWRWSGQLALSRQLLWALAERDPQCIHATSIAVHGIVESLARMRTTLLKDARRRDVLAPAHAASAGLVAPRLLLRSCSRHLQAPFLRDPLAPGTLVVFRLRKMHAGTEDDGLALARDRWNQCPAHSIVPKLLGEVWTTARQEWTQLRYTHYRPSAIDRVSGGVFGAVNRVIPWHRLPTPLGLINLASLRVALRERNLHTPPSRSAPGTGCPVAWTPQVRSARTADGTYNDLADPAMGSAGTCFGRNVPLTSVRVEREPALLQPNPRLISRRLMTRGDFIPARTLNVLAAAWIQFQVHDWFNHKPSPHERPFEVEIEPDDDKWPGERPMRVDRTERHDPGSRPDAPPAFVNTETHWWDASQLYGSSLALQHPLRAWQDGKLRVESDGRLPYNQQNGLEVAGFTNNWWVGLSLLHSLFTLEHNAICDRLRAEHPGWDDEQLFSTARLVNAALIAKIHSLEWTPAILGHPTVQIGMRANWWGFVGERLQRLVGRLGEWDVLWGIPGSTADHHSAPYAITEEFVSIYRMHPLMPDDFTFFSVRDGSMLETPDRNGVMQKTRDLAGVAGFNTPPLRASVATADLLYSLGIAHPGAITLHNYPKALQGLERPGHRPEPDKPPIDVAAIDILRDRERGVPRYNAFRKLLHLPPVRTFEELSPRWAAELRAVYQHVDRIDLMVGLFAEAPPKGCGFSDTAFRVFVLMASRRLKSDRFFTTDFTPAVYTQTGLDWIARTEMKDVLLRHYPALAPAIQRVANAFAPWDRVAAAP